MTNNDILRRLRYCFNYNNHKMLKVFDAAKVRQASTAEFKEWLKRDDEDGYKAMKDVDFATFLNGLINFLRGERDGYEPVAETKLDNNLIFRKLKIALNLKSDDILDILKLADFRFSEHELSALFRNPQHRHYRICKDQVLRNFLVGLRAKMRQA